MSVIGVRLALVFGVLAMVGTALPPAGHAQWQPFGDDSFSSSTGSRPNRAARSNRPPPPTTQQLLISKATDQAMCQAILQYEQIVAAGGWPAILPGPKLKFGS